MEIKVEPVKCKDLKPGDLFSIANQDEWDSNLEWSLSIGEKVYIRTNIPCPEDQRESEIYRVTIITLTFDIN